MQYEHDLKNLGFQKIPRIFYQQPPEVLYAEALKRGEAAASRGGALVVRTGAYTGRLPDAKFFVREPGSESKIDWGKVNRPIEPERFDALLEKTLRYLEGRDLFVQDAAAGADPAYRVGLRLVSESAVHALFAHWMFIRSVSSAGASVPPEYTILHAPRLHADPAKDGVPGDAFILIHLARKIILIGGTGYAGEIKKAVFTLMNYLLPDRGVLPLHSSSNCAPGETHTAFFFGLSGTGKTTLSADPERVLIGDDEHGWSGRGVFNFEGGCYAKAIRLSSETEPEIYAAIHRRGAILENVVMDAEGRLDLDSDSITENTRAIYPIDFMPHMAPEGQGGPPRHILMLACDAFGVLPPLSRLTAGQAVYHFLSGYTAKVAGTEAGVKTPQATFSACFGAPFMPRPPVLYAGLLRERILKEGVEVWLVNTGWIGGAYGTGRRIPLPATRAMVKAILSGALQDAAFEKDPVFQTAVPLHCPGVPDEMLRQQALWKDPAAYAAAARALAALFHKNFKSAGGAAFPELEQEGPR